jgi:hypothetical protein
MPSFQRPFSWQAENTDEMRTEIDGIYSRMLRLIIAVEDLKTLSRKTVRDLDLHHKTNFMVGVDEENSS